MRLRGLSKLLCGCMLLGAISVPRYAMAVDCTGTLPGANCTLDEDTTAALTIDNAVVLTVGGSVTIGHTVDGSANNVGSVNTNGTGVTVTQSAAIGGNAPIDSLSIGDGDTWTTSADIITNADGGDANNGAVAADIDLGTGDGGESLNLNGGLSIRGQIDGHAADTLTVGADTNGGSFTIASQVNTINLNVASGSLLTDSSVGAATPLATLVVANGASMTLGGAASTVTTMDLDGQIAINAGNSLTVQTYNADANGGTITIGLDRDSGTTDNGTLLFTGGGPVDLSNATLTVSIAQGSEILASETIDNIIQGNGGATTAPTLSDSSFLYDFQLNPDGANNVDLVITRQSFNDATTSADNETAVTVLLSDLAVTDDTIVQVTQANLVNASSQQEFNEIIESTTPAMDSSGVTVSNVITNKTVQLAQQRIANLRTGRTSGSGISSGSGYTGKDKNGGRVWGQVFAASGEQGTRDGIDGYDVDAAGVTFGGDTGNIHDNLTIGALLTYANTNTKSSNANSTTADVDSYQIGGYGTYQFDNDVYLNGTVTWGVNEIASYRQNVGGTGTQAKAQYDSEQISVYLETGKSFQEDMLILTPSFSAHYSYVETENYRERGAAGLNLTVSGDSIHALEIGPKITSQWEYETDEGWYVVPEVSAGYRYDLIGDESEAFATYEAGGPQMAFNGFSSQQHVIDLGFGGTYNNDTWEFQANYDYEFRGDFSIHAGYLRGAYKF